MRARFFLIIFSVLTVVAMGATFLHGMFLHRERLALLDQQVRDTATALLDSQINELRNIDFDTVEDILSEELGESRIGKFFVIRNDEQKVIFESKSAALLPIKEIPQMPQWITFNEKGSFIRILNLKLPRIPGRTLQVGIVVDESLIRPSYLSLPNLAFIGCIFVLGLGVSWGLTSTLLKPISQLVDFITGATNEAAYTLPPLPRHLQLSGSAGKKDELNRLLDSFSRLLEKVNRGQRVSRVWSYQMAHELKTPLAVAEGEIEQAKKSGELTEKTARRIRAELMEASDTVTAFLTWAELEGASPQKNLFVVSVRKAVLDIKRRLEGRFPGRLFVEIKNDFYVLAGLQHFEHMTMNLILNALVHSPGEVRVSSSSPNILAITDQGSGIPPGVIERLGDPFNKGEPKRTEGHGLGLAYVQSVCKLYGWTLKIESSNTGTEILIAFPSLGEGPRAEGPTASPTAEA